MNVPIGRIVLAALVAHLCQTEPGQAATPLHRKPAPFRILYDNDSTNLTSCISPWRHGGEITARQLRGLVDEVADTQVDAYLFCPGLGNAPWWPSEAEPDYWQWWRKHVGRGPGPWGRFVVRGEDPVRITLDRVRKRGMAAFISFRLNDQQGIRACRLWQEHPEYRLSHPPAAKEHVWSWELECFDFAAPKVRDYKLALIAELVRNYDIDGFQLDLMRQPLYFRVFQTTVAARVDIMTEFIRKVRRLLDAKGGRRRYLCLRIPNRISRLDYMGIDLRRLVDEKLVDLLNVSPWLVHQQESDLPKFRKLLPQMPLYYEMTHSVHYGLRRNLYGRDAGDGKVGRLATAPMYGTTALLALEQGADGVSFFNFVYTRPCRTRAGISKGVEPPFQVLVHAADREWLARQPQHYFLATRFGTWTVEGQLPAAVSVGKSVDLTVHVAPQAEARRTRNPALLRIELSRAIEHSSASASLNGCALKMREWAGEPFQHYYQDKNTLEPGHVLHYAVPREAIQPGDNAISLELLEGAPARVVYLDLAIDARHRPLGR